MLAFASLADSELTDPAVASTSLALTLHALSLRWKLGGDCTDQDVSQAKQELDSRMNHTIRDVLHWRNPPPLQSLPDIDHIHILALTATTNEDNDI